MAASPTFTASMTSCSASCMGYLSSAKLSDALFFCTSLSKKKFAKCPWRAVFFPVCEYAAVELPYLFQCGFTNTPEIIKNMTPEQLNEKVNEALENNESENIYPRTPHYAHYAVSQSIPKGTPLWPFGRFIKYQKMERQMKNKCAESLQTHLTISRRSHGLPVQ